MSFQSPRSDHLDAFVWILSGRPESRRVRTIVAHTCEHMTRYRELFREAGTAGLI